MIHVMWRASVSIQRLKTQDRWDVRWEHICAQTHVSVSAPTAGETNILLVSLPPQSWQTWKGLPGPGTMVTDAPCTRWVLLRWVFFGAESSSLSLGLIPSLSLMECSPFSYLCPLLSRPPIHSVAWPHYPAKIVPSSKTAVNHDDGALLQ